MAREHFNRHYLYNLLHCHGLTETQLSIDLNISQPTVSYWLRGKVNPSAENLLKLSDRFNIPVERFGLRMINQIQKRAYVICFSIYRCPVGSAM